MCGWIGNGILARAPIRPNSAWKALGVIGPSRSVIKTCEDGPCSRCRRRSARISSPCIGWTLGEPFFALRTCSRPVVSSTCDHCRSHNSDARGPSILCRHPFAAPDRPRPGRNVRARIAQHHHAVSCGRHQIIALFDDLAILAMVQPKFLEPISQMTQHLEAPRLHAREHVHQSSLDRHAAILELSVLEKHAKAFRLILFRKRNASTFHCLAAPVARPRPRKKIPPRLDCGREHNHRCLAYAMRAADVNRVSVAIPY